MIIVEAFKEIATNLSSNPEILIMLIINGPGLIFLGYDFRIGLLVNSALNLLIFVWFYSVNMSWWYPLVALLTFLVLLTFSLYATQQSGEAIV